MTRRRSGQSSRRPIWAPELVSMGERKVQVWISYAQKSIKNKFKTHTNNKAGEKKGRIWVPEIIEGDFINDSEQIVDFEGKMSELEKYIYRIDFDWLSQ